ncbi:MAG: hypothetical protein JWO19_3901 [Bryobacterales bacterium]|nr:hypothetical protein [Bryobacterales bacterium]
MKWALVLTGCLVLSSNAVAQVADSATTQELIQKLLNRIDTLEMRLTELEKAASPTPTPVAQAPRPARPPEAEHDHDAPPQPETAGQITYPSLKISGFSDFNFAASDLHGPSGGFGAATLLNSHTGFQEGQFILHFSSALSPRVSFFGELSFTARPDAGTGTPAAPGFNAEVERAAIRFSQSDYLKVSFGRYHTPINYWNTAFHHGQWLQTTISRPEMIQFGGSFIPVHFVGSLVEGVIPAKGLNLNYNLGLGNGRSTAINRSGDFGDVNNHRAWLANVFIRPDSLYALQVGGSVYRDEISPATGLPTREWIQSGHIVWHSETPEVIAEFANVTHKPVNGASVVSNSQAFYAQVAYRLPWQQKLWKPYYRFEQIHVPRSDVIFRGVPTFSASTTGIRYDISTFAAFKLEYRYYDRRGLPKIHGAFSQVSFTF